MPQLNSCCFLVLLLVFFLFFPLFHLEKLVCSLPREDNEEGGGQGCWGRRGRCKSAAALGGEGSPWAASLCPVLYSWAQVRKQTNTKKILSWVVAVGPHSLKLGAFVWRTATKARGASQAGPLNSFSRGKFPLFPVPGVGNVLIIDLSRICIALRLSRIAD